MDKQKTLYSENRFLKKEFFKYLQIAFAIGVLYSAGSSKPTAAGLSPFRGGTIISPPEP